MTLPFWLDPVYDSVGMTGADRWAIDQAGVPSLSLMEAAGEALARETEEIAGPDPVKVLCGKGNNGGDGLVAARHLAEWGHRVEVLMILGREDLSEDAKANLDRLDGIPVLEGGPALDAIRGEGTFIDAILGTGFSGLPREPVADAIERLGLCSGPVVACDVPTGVDASTGEAVLAAASDLTVTFHGLKVGHLVNPGKALCGTVRVTEIGIPDGAPPGDAAGVTTPEVVDLLPPRGADSTKFSSGRVSVVGGSRGLTGAVSLASLAAARAGAGYVTATVPGSLEPVFEVKLTEVMTVGCPDDGSGSFSGDAVDSVVGHCRGADAVLLGSGIGRTPDVVRLVESVVSLIEAPLVIDADALSVLGTNLSCVAEREAPTVMTPHPGEMARMLGIDADQVEARRLASVLDLIERTGATVLLKGDDTIVCDGSMTAINDRPSPALATAGTGDVLAGMIAAFIARGLDPFPASAAAALCHAEAGVVATGKSGLPEGVIASDVITAIPAAVATLTNPDRGVE